MTRIRNIHSEFNAKMLTTQEVCDGYINNPYFPQLASSSHSIVVGPRGSGKTTLMKMLQNEALDYWNQIGAEEYRRSIDFSGVFIPTDSVWIKQYSFIESRNASDLPRVKDVATNIFIYHTMERVLECLESRINPSRGSHGFRRIEQNKGKEDLLVRELSPLWKLKPRIASLRSLITSAKQRRHELNSLLYQVDIDHSIVFPQPLELHTNLVNIIADGLKLINSTIGNTNDKWALLFDELELAPRQMVQPLIDAMRGDTSPLILKLSMSPYFHDIELGRYQSGSYQNQDFSYINLSVQSDSRSQREFAKQLYVKIDRKHTGNLSVTNFEEPKDFDRQKVFEELSKKDTSFFEYLASRKIDIGNLNNYSDKDLLPQIRKIQYAAMLRNIYYSQHGRKRSLRRAPNYYGGFYNIAKEVEYNPRMLISIFDNLIQMKSVDEDVVSIANQVKALELTRSYYLSFIDSITTGSSEFPNLGKFVEKVGLYFYKDLHSGKFQAEPKGSFVVDKSTSSSIRELIGQASNTGALVQVREKKNDSRRIDFEVNDGDRYRLSYIFASKYSLPLQLQRPVKFSKIMSSNKVVESDDMSTDIQPELTGLL